MNCTDARAALLEADPVELRGEAETAVSLHLRECAACRATADAILATEAAAGRRIQARAPRSGAADAVARGRSAAERRRRARWGWLVPLAAAAGIVTLILTRPGPHPPGEEVGVVREPAPGRIAVEAPVGRSVAVFETTDPDIVIIWLF